MDALTSTAGVSGCRAVIEAANAFGRFFNARSRRRQGAAIRGVHCGRWCGGPSRHRYRCQPGRHRSRQRHARRGVADQVKSLGGEFVKVDYEEEGSGGGGYAKVMSEGLHRPRSKMYAKQAKDADIIITTALIPGKPAPKLITAEMVQA